MCAKRSRLPQQAVEAEVESLSHDGRGVARIEGKTVFIDGALPGEKVMFRYRSTRKQFDEGEVVEVLQPSVERVTPPCAHFGTCGGCSLMHLESEQQIAVKQQQLLDNLQRIGHVSPDEVLAPITGPVQGYRHKARLGVKYVKKKNRVLVGFRERRSPFLADMQSCLVLHPSVGNKLLSLGELVGSLSIPQQIPQIEVAVTETVTALVFRHMQDLTEDDMQKLRDYAIEENFAIYLQSGGPKTITPLHPADPQLVYHLEDYQVSFQFGPSDFTQVNPVINRQMIARSLELLDLHKEQRVLELFCGLGNFTLPIATRVAHVTGVEGDKGLVERAIENARRQDIGNTDIHVANLMEDVEGAAWLKESYDRILLDPPRSGAMEMMPHIGRLAAERLVYVSCNPATLARDAGILVNEYGYHLQAAGIMDMFPHTAHVESMALFTRNK